MDFEAIIRAVIDTASAEAQLNSLLKERQIKIEPVIDSKMYDGMNKQLRLLPLLLLLPEVKSISRFQIVLNPEIFI